MHMLKNEGYPAFLRYLPAKEIGASVLLLTLVAGCDSRPDEKNIDCLSSPGGSVFEDLDMSKPGEKTVLGDRRQRPPDPEVGVYDDTYEIEVSKTSGVDGTTGENILMASSNSGASPVGQGGTLEDIRNEPDSEMLLFENPRQPGQEPPYYRLTALAKYEDSAIVQVAYTCDQSQLPA